MNWWEAYEVHRTKPFALAFLTLPRGCAGDTCFSPGSDKVWSVWHYLLQNCSEENWVAEVWNCLLSTGVCHTLYCHNVTSFVAILLNVWDKSCGELACFSMLPFIVHVNNKQLESEMAYCSEDKHVLLGSVFSTVILAVFSITLEMHPQTAQSQTSPSASSPPDLLSGTTHFPGRTQCPSIVPASPEASHAWPGI